MKFNDRLRQLREERRQTQREGAIQLGIDPAKYNKWENGVNRPDYETLFRLADYYNVTIDYLLGYSNTRSKDPTYAIIGRTTGLTDKSIKILQLHYSKSKDNTYTDTVNLLLEDNLLIHLFKYYIFREKGIVPPGFEKYIELLDNKNFNHLLLLVIQDKLDEIMNIEGYFEEQEKLNETLAEESTTEHPTD